MAGGGRFETVSFMNPKLILAVALALLLLVSAPAQGVTPAAFTYWPAAPAPGEPSSSRPPTTRRSRGTSTATARSTTRGRPRTRAFEAGAHVVRLRARYRRPRERRERSRSGPARADAHTDGDARADARQPRRPSTRRPSPGSPRLRPGGLCAGLFAREQKPHTIDASPSHDPDGTIVRYEWDLDGTGGFEATGAPTVTHTFERYKGSSSRQAHGPRARHRRRGRDRRGRDDADAARAQCEPARHRPPARDRHLPAPRTARWTSADPISVNGIVIAPRANRTVAIDQRPQIASNGAAVSVTAKGAP